MTKTRIMLRACPRCHGDLFPDDYEEDFACLQCGRRFDVAQILRQTAELKHEVELSKAA
jgi:hypothetical protein